MSSPAKKAKTAEEGAEPKVEVVEEKQDEVMKDEPEEKQKELETDAPASKKPCISNAVEFLVKDTTLNVMPSVCGGLLKQLSEGGLRHLLAGARANVGVTSGRYMYEVQIVEFPPQQDDRKSSKGPRPSNMLKVGFSTKTSDLLLGEDADGICFDNEGYLTRDSKKTKVASKFYNGSVVAVLLNLDKKSPNYNTVSLFKDGVRASDPQALPESLHNKTLFPTITFRNVTPHVNFGPEPITALPFVCRLVGSADKGDVEEVLAPKPPKDGKNEILYPVALPGEGPFQWLDLFLKKNPMYTEISNRSLATWARKSGLYFSGRGGPDASYDQPEMPFIMEDSSVRRILEAVMPVQQRDYVVMELKANLVEEDRKGLLARFPSASFKKVACVVVGEPTASFKSHTQDFMLKDKQEKSDAKFLREQAEAKKKREQEKAHAKRLKQLEVAKKKTLEKKRKLEAEQKAQADAAKAEGEEDKKDAKAEGEEQNKDAKAEGEEEKKDVDMKDGEQKADGVKEEEGKDETKKENTDDVVADEEEEEQKEEEPESEQPDEKPPKVELTDEEKQLKFIKSETPDMGHYLLSTTFAHFSLPKKSEGFDDIRYEWAEGQKSEEYMKKWILDKKQTTRIEDLKPSSWFHDLSAQWQKESRKWVDLQRSYKAALSRKEAAKARNEAAAAKAAAAKQGVEEEKKETEGTQETEEKQADVEADKKEGDAEKKEELADEKGAKADEGAAEPAEEKPEKDQGEGEEKLQAEDDKQEDEAMIDFDGIDVFGVEDVCDVGGGMPLFKEFQSEDWTMASLRYELSLLVHAFRRDVDDPDRTGIHIDHLGFYYNKYYRKPLALKTYGVETSQELLKLVKDTVYLTKQQVLESFLPDELESLGIFAKLVEEARRHRNVLLDSGDDSARLKVQSDRGQGWGGRREFDGGKSKGGGKRAGPAGSRDASSKGYGGKPAASGPMHYGAPMPASKGYPPVGMGAARMQPGGFMGGKPGYGMPAYGNRGGAFPSHMAGYGYMPPAATGGGGKSYGKSFGGGKDSRGNDGRDGKGGSRSQPYGRSGRY